MPSKQKLANMRAAVTTLSLLALSDAAHNQYVATFSGLNGIYGNVTIDNGYVIVDLNMSAEPEINGDFSECTSGGMKYHIHMSWEHDNDTDRIGSTQCGSTYTGGHWDPWHGMFVCFVPPIDTHGGHDM